MPGGVGTPSESPGDSFIIYKWRWYVLAVVSLLNISNAAVWISFSPILNYAAVFYDQSTDAINYFSMVFFICTIPMGLVAMVVIDKFGLRTGILIGAVLNGIGAVVRATSTGKFVDHENMFWVSMLGQTISAISQAFVLIIPTKVAEYWFPDNQRAIATSIISMANPLGIIVGVLIPSIIVNKEDDIRLLNVIIALPSLLSSILAVAGIRSSTPPTPPSYSATVEVRQEYLANLKLLGSNRAYVVLAFALGAGLGGVSALLTVLQQFLCARGYKDTFTGMCMALLIASGLVGAGISGTIVDKTKMFTETTKICFSFTALSSILYAIFVNKHDHEAIIVVSCCLIGLFGFAAYPVGLELGVECSYPVAEATSSGIIIVLGQLLGVAFVQIMTVLRQPLSSYDEQFAKCSLNQSSSNATSAPSEYIKAYDMTVPGLSFAGFLCFISIVLVVFFKTEYKRLKAEDVNKAKIILNQEVSSVSSQTSFSESGQYRPIFS